MTMDIRRFGVGHRLPDGPPGAIGIEGQVIESGPGGVISEVAFSLRARIPPHASPNWTFFVVIEGGGWVGVGDERARVLAGETVAWPPDIPHAAWTDGTQMRAIVVEFAAPRLALPGVVEGAALPPGRPASKGEGRLVERRGPRRHQPGDDTEGEPL